ncbi:lipoyltransferase 1, mitochondrial-like [Argiope bruennichi]|uniref:lipoyltransferase 1, mitochondrial-like n=1 Tax=Argiope bruennichi TaxID=94029 RepID=UPI0024948A52|nr:lipoyltransferase 1, mitochondrial-like [Argiope bruennichi]
MQFFKIPKFQIISFFRCFSATSLKMEITNFRKNPLSIEGHNSIIISQSYDIFQNLALENWLYTSCDFSTSNISVLLMWFNEPSVVIGRHQNPWIECAVKFCETNGINIARRNSGGGTVYHDLGNLNLSFLTSRKDYNRKRNLELVCNSINKRWCINLNISKRHDILYNDQYKVSGTASKLGRKNAYHHCTVLVDVDEAKLHQALHRKLESIESKATSSIRAEVINLKSLCSDIDTAKVIEAITSYYKQVYEVQDDHVFYINPNENVFPGINQIQEELKSWDWCFGHTPRFTITKSFQIKAKNPVVNVEILMSINKGKIENISLDPQILKSESYNTLKQCIINNPFSILIDNSLTAWMHHSDDKMVCQIVKHNILQMILGVLR